MKRVLSFILVLSMVLGSMGMAFAAPTTFEDVTDKNVAKAVERLKAFGIVDGYEDGTYRPEKEVTREEFAKLLVTALGMDHAANAVAYTGFADVEAGRWSAGYVAVAAGQGLIIGDPNGNFRPADKVSYAEAVTMLVRAIGYKDEFLKGTWPGNFIAKAAEAGISSGVKFANAEGYANRGDVALLVDNTLDADLIKVDTYEGAVIKYYESDVTFLEDKLEIYNLEEVVVTGTPNVDKGINKEQVKVEYTKDLEFKKSSKNADKGDVDTFDVANNVEVDNLLGLSLNVYINDKDEVIYVEESRRPFTVLYDVIDEDEKIEEDSITLVNIDREYQFETGKNEGDYTIYIDNKAVSFKTFKEEAAKGNLFVKAVLNNKGNIKLVEAHRFDVDGHVVKENKDGIVTYFETGEDDEYKVKVKDYDKVVVFDMEGNLMDFEDIKVDDVIYVNDKNLDGDDLEQAATKDEVAYILVVRDVIEGKAQSYRGSASFEIDGKFYDVSGANKTTVSIDQDAKIDLYGDSTRELDDLTGEEGNVVALLDFKGEIRHIRSDVKSSSKDMYGVITGVDTRYSDIYVKMLNYDEKTVEYELDLDDAYGYEATALVNGKVDSDDNADALSAITSGDSNGKKVAKGDIVRYNINSNGDISEIELLAYFDGTGFTKAKTGYQSKDVDLVLDEVKKGHDIAKRSIEVDGKYYAVKDDIVVFNYTPAYDSVTSALKDPADVEVANWSEIVDKHVEAGTELLVVNDKLRGSAELVVFLTKFDAIGDDAFAGYVTNIMTKDGDRFAEIVKPGESEAKRYELNKKADYSVKDGFERRNVVVFKEKSNGKVEAAFADTDFKVITGKVEAIRGRSLEIATNNKTGSEKTVENYRLDSDAIFYQKGNRKTLSDISSGDYVRVVVEKGMISVVKRYDAQTKDIEATKPDGDANLFLVDYKHDMKADWLTGGATGTPGAIKGNAIKGITGSSLLVEVDGKTEVFTFADGFTGFTTTGTNNAALAGAKIAFEATTNNVIYNITGLELNAGGTLDTSVKINGDIVVNKNMTIKNVTAEKIYVHAEKVTLTNVNADRVDVNAEGMNTLTLDGTTVIKTVNVNKKHKVEVKETAKVTEAIVVKAEGSKVTAVDATKVAAIKVEAKNVDIADNLDSKVEFTTNDAKPVVLDAVTKTVYNEVTGKFDVKFEVKVSNAKTVKIEEEKLGTTGKTLNVVEITKDGKVVGYEAVGSTTDAGYEVGGKYTFKITAIWNEANKSTAVTRVVVPEKK